MSPFLESESYPRGRRLLIVPVGLVFLIGPYGSMLGGGHKDLVRLALTFVSIAICTALLSLGITIPRRRVTADGDTRTITISSTPPPPYFMQRVVTRSFDDVTGLSVDEVGTRTTPQHGYRVTITFREGPALHLKRHGNSDYAQDTIDHFVLLGLPGHSRAEAREAMVAAEPPVTWL